MKVPAAIGIIYIGWDSVPRTSIRDRIRPVVTAALIGATVMGTLSLVTGLGWGWPGDLSGAEIRAFVVGGPATGSGIFITDVIHMVGFSVSEQSVLSFTRGLGLVAAGVIGVWLLLHADKKGSLRAIGLTLLAVVLLTPVVQPWYLLWALVLLSPIAVGWIKRLLIVLSGRGRLPRPARWGGAPPRLPLLEPAVRGGCATRASRCVPGTARQGPTRRLGGKPCGRCRFRAAHNIPAPIPSLDADEGLDLHENGGTVVVPSRKDTARRVLTGLPGRQQARSASSGHLHRSVRSTHGDLEPAGGPPAPLDD